MQQCDQSVSDGSRQHARAFQGHVAERSAGGRTLKARSNELVEQIYRLRLWSLAGHVGFCVAGRLRRRDRAGDGQRDPVAQSPLTAPAQEMEDITKVPRTCDRSRRLIRIGRLLQLRTSLSRANQSCGFR